MNGCIDLPESKAQVEAAMIAGVSRVFGDWAFWNEYFVQGRHPKSGRSAHSRKQNELLAGVM
jgi:hypothetical protein